MKDKKEIATVMKDLAGYLEPEDVNRMLAAAKDDTEWLLLYLLFRTGRRISELLLLKPSDINYRRGDIIWTILKKRSKGYKAIKKVSTETLYVLEAYIGMWRCLPDEYVFQSTYIPDRPYTRYWAFKRIKAMGDRIGLSKLGLKQGGVHPHHLRHSYAIHMVTKSKSQAALKTVQMQLDHSNLATTSVYLQFSQEEVGKILDEVFDKE